jgi:hypothetical protein
VGEIYPHWPGTLTAVNFSHSWFFLEFGAADRVRAAHIAQKTRHLIEYPTPQRQAFTKGVSIVSIPLKSGDLFPFGASSCTKLEEEPNNYGVDRHLASW